MILGSLVPLAECPIGLFLTDAGELCLKTEYSDNQGKIDAFIVSSGEFFWGHHPQTIKNQRRQMVRSVTLGHMNYDPSAPSDKKVQMIVQLALEFVESIVSDVILTGGLDDDAERLKDMIASLSWFQDKE